MKKAIITLFILFLALVSMTAQDWNEEQDIFIKIGLSDAQVKEIQKINLETITVIEPADVKIRLYRSQIEQLLLSIDVDMVQVEKYLRQAMEEELKIRLVKIEREVKIKKLIGERKWIEYNYFIKKKPVNKDDSSMKKNEYKESDKAKDKTH